MARSRQHPEQYWYGEWHRQFLSDLYERTGHRLDMADRDWTEFCNGCKWPLGHAETVHDRGQDLSDKGVSVTRNLAKMTGLAGVMIAYRTGTPVDIYRKLRTLDFDASLRLCDQYPIVSFKVRRLWPQPTGFVTFTPADWAAEILLLHRSHHATCEHARRARLEVRNGAALTSAQWASRIWVVPRQPVLFEPEVVE